MKCIEIALELIFESLCIRVAYACVCLPTRNAIFINVTDINTLALYCAYYIDDVCTYVY